MSDAIPIVIPTCEPERANEIQAQIEAGPPGIQAHIQLVDDSGRGGFTRAANAGLRVVLEMDTLYIGIMSDDTKPKTENWLWHLATALEQSPHHGYAAPLMPCRTEGIMGVEPVTEPHIVEHWGVPFGCVLIRREVFRDVGLLDPLFRHYASDTDHQFRARRFDWKSVVCYHVWVDREVHEPRQPDWTRDQALLKQRWPM